MLGTNEKDRLIDAIGIISGENDFMSALLMAN
jgi:hypothetical protein